jgi:transcriptional regulator GlxA family with amidase domain
MSRPEQGADQVGASILIKHGAAGPGIVIAGAGRRGTAAVERALRFIENRLAADISLEAIARAAGVSKHHRAHAFGTATRNATGFYAARAFSPNRP